MINLLPTKEKKELIKEYRVRIAVVSLWALLFFLISAAAFFSPAYYSVWSTTTNLTNELTQKRQILPEGGEDIEKKLSEMKIALERVKPVDTYATRPPHEFLE